MKKQLDKLIHKAMWISIIAFVVRAVISWQEIIHTGIRVYEIFGFIGEAVAFSAVVMLCYEKWIWRIDPSVSIPYIAGEYEGLIKTTYDQKCIGAFLKITQTLLSVEVTLRTDESISHSLYGAVEEINGTNQLIYTYLNEPKAIVKGKSPIHYGTATFLIDNGMKLIGKYYTDRKTTGDLEFEKKHN